jgi:3',5'-cyclic AMP phosphodiesterase CpdA
MHFWRAVSVICVLPLMAQTGCSPVSRQSRQEADTESATGSIVVRDSALRHPLRFIVYGDMRFTTTSETELSNPGPRQALVARIAGERPDALFLTGDIPLHGGNEDDYREFVQETAVWRTGSLRVFPVLGNHEFQQCAEPDCLRRWWRIFPQLHGRRWYGVALGSQLQLLALDSNASLMPGSEQSQWLQHQIEALGEKVRFVLILLHHPPMTDGPQGVRANESALATTLTAAAALSGARFVVCAAHVHNYERFERDGIVFLVSGGGGAKPVPVQRSATDLYYGSDFPNFHYLRFELTTNELSGEMVRLSDPDSATPGTWAVQDRFAINARRH